MTDFLLEYFFVLILKNLIAMFKKKVNLKKYMTGLDPQSFIRKRATGIGF